MRHTITPSLWTGLALGPAAWISAQQLGFLLASFCVSGGPGLILGIHTVALGLAGLSIFLCLQGWRGTGTHGGRAERHFLGGVGAMLGAICALAILS
jgi:hypothetical protein